MVLLEQVAPFIDHALLVNSIVFADDQANPADKKKSPRAAGHRGTSDTGLKPASGTCEADQMIGFMALM